ncbi:MAG: hypothetical protein ABIP75_15555 [Pyrinomonadaceae bacterium]
MKFRFALCAALALTCLFIGSNVYAQGVTTIRGDANAGELNSAMLDQLVITQQNSMARIFVIARLGRGETSAALNLQRLQAARDYLVKTRGVAAEKVVFASGDRIDGEGRLEFYLGSDLQLITLATRGKNVTLVCCLDTVTPKHRRRGRH